MIDFSTLNATILRSATEGPKIYTLKALLHFEKFDPLADYWVYYMEYGKSTTGWICTADKNNILLSSLFTVAVQMKHTGMEKIDGEQYVVFTHGYKGLHSEDE